MLDKRVKLRHLQCFQLVAQQQSFEKAARILAVTAPAVSKTISELEEISAVRLFTRSKKGAELTPQGKVFFDYVQTGLGAIQTGANLMSKHGNPAGDVIRIGASPSITASFVPQVLLEFQKHSESEYVRIALHNGTTAHLMAQLRDQQFDLILCRHHDPEAMMGLSFEFLFVDPLVIVVRTGHPLLDGSHVEADSLRAFPVILPIKESIYRQWADAFVSALRIDPTHNVIENLSISFGRAYTTQSNAVWVVSWSAVINDVRDKVLINLPLSMKGNEVPGFMARTTGLIMRTDSNPTSAVRLLISIIRKMAEVRRKQDA